MNREKVVIPARVLCIGAGEGGSSLAMRVVEEFNKHDEKKQSKCLIMNLSTQDMDKFESLPDNNILKLGGNDIHGAGKDPKVAKAIFDATVKGIVDWCVKHAQVSEDETPYEFIFVMFSSGGGTGCAIGPSLTSILTTEEIQERLGYDCIVQGIPISPELSNDEGSASFENTLYCMDRINTMIKNNFARFAIVDNNSVPQIGISRENQLATINGAAAQILYRYISVYRHGVRSLDKADRKKLMSMMNLHSYIVLDEDCKFNPFVCPYGVSTAALGYEIQNDKEEALKKFITRNGIKYDFTIPGLFEQAADENVKETSILHFANFRNIEKFTEKYRAKVQQIQEESENDIKTFIDNSTGLNNLKEESEARQEKYSPKAAASLKDIMSI